MSFPVENIREACRDRGTTIAEVERVLGIGNGVIAKWEFAKRTPPVDRITAIAEYLNVSSEQLIYGKQKPATKGDGLAKDEIELIRLFRAASPETRASILHLLRVVESGQSSLDEGEADR